ncbi:hypothetical protein J6590_038873 [Homalodisca vitripennis]|nr:hypothetical protein J6590_038873 [Homalodisca vitripennis]
MKISRRSIRKRPLETKVTLRIRPISIRGEESSLSGEHLGYPSADIITTMAERRRQWTETPDNARVLTTIADPSFTIRYYNNGYCKHSRASLAAVTAPTRLLFDVCVKSALCGVNVTFARFLAGLSFYWGPFMFPA